MAMAMCPCHELDVHDQDKRRFDMKQDIYWALVCGRLQYRLHIFKFRSFHKKQKDLGDGVLVVPFHLRHATLWNKGRSCVNQGETNKELTQP